MNGRRRPLIVVIVGFVVVAAVGGAGLLLLLRRSESSAAGGRRSCMEAIWDLVEVDDAVKEKDGPPWPNPTPGWDLVEIAFRDGGLWAFTDDGTGTPLGTRSEGAFEFGPGMYKDRVDLIRIDQTVPQGQPRWRERRVMIEENSWVEDASSPDRLTCRAVSISSSSLGAEPFLDRLRRPDRPDPDAPNINPGMSVLAKVISTEVVDGVTMTTYEQHPVEKYENVRTRFTLDVDGQLRSAEAVDTTTGKVLYHRTARPDPNHPPIKDPTGEPIVSMNP